MHVAVRMGVILELRPSRPTALRRAHQIARIGSTARTSAEAADFNLVPGICRIVRGPLVGIL